MTDFCGYTHSQMDDPQESQVNVSPEIILAFPQVSKERLQAARERYLESRAKKGLPPLPAVLPEN